MGHSGAGRPLPKQLSPLPRGLPQHSWPLQPSSVPPPAKPFFPGTSALWQFIFWSFTVTLLRKPSFNSLPYGYYTKKKKKKYTYILEDVSFTCNPLDTQYSGRPIIIDERTWLNAGTLFGNNDVWIVLSLRNPSICLPHNYNSWQDANFKFNQYTVTHA